jgi:hypothetical protein
VAGHLSRVRFPASFLGRNPFCGATVADCPACLEAIPLRSGAGRPPKWCSGRCRRLVSRLGGPIGTAEYFEGQASFCDAIGRAFDNQDAKDRAVEWRRKATALRQMVR